CRSAHERRRELQGLCAVRAAPGVSGGGGRRRARGGDRLGPIAVLFITGHGQGHVQSVVLGSMLFVVAVQLAALGVIGDLLAANRTLIQRTMERTRRIELQLGVEPSHYERGERRAEPRGETDEAEQPTVSVPLGGPT